MPSILFVTFGGALAPLGTVPIQWFASNAAWTTGDLTDAEIAPVPAGCRVAGVRWFVQLQCLSDGFVPPNFYLKLIVAASSHDPFGDVDFQFILDSASPPLPGDGTLNLDSVSPFLLTGSGTSSAVGPLEGSAPCVGAASVVITGTPP